MAEIKNIGEDGASLDIVLIMWTYQKQAFVKPPKYRSLAWNAFKQVVENLSEIKFDSTSEHFGLIKLIV